MNRIITLSFLFLSVSILYSADKKLLETKNLEKFLPQSEVEGYTRIQHASPSSTPTITSALVQYMKMPEKTAKDFQTVSAGIIIMDGIMNLDNIESQIKIEYEGEEPFIVKGKYKGKRNIRKSTVQSENSCYVCFIVSGRFVLSININGSSDFTIAEKFLNMIDLNGLESAGGN